MIFPNPVLLLYFFFSPAVAVLFFLIRSYWRFWWCRWLLYSSCADRFLKLSRVSRVQFLWCTCTGRLFRWYFCSGSCATPDSNIPSQFPDIVFFFRWSTESFSHLSLQLRIRTVWRRAQHTLPDRRSFLLCERERRVRQVEVRYLHATVRCALRYTLHHSTRRLFLSHSLVEWSGWFYVGVLVCLLRSVFGNTSFGQIYDIFRCWFEDYRGIEYRGSKLEFNNL